jgi:hypothetical protein
MALIDQHAAAKAVEDRLSRTSDPRQRGMLETVAEHLRAEVVGDVGRLLATLVDDPVYHLWSEGHDVGPHGVDGVLAYYSDLVAARRQVLEFTIERIVVDADTVVTEGWIRAINLGAVARARGWHVDDDEASYLVTQRVVIFWPFDAEGRMLGEDGYANFDPDAVQRLADHELPDAYRQLFAGAH